jgi:hypothetical protein
LNGVDDLSERIRSIIFWVVTIIVALINIKYVQFDSVLIRMMVRIPQVILLGMFYKYFVKKKEMKTTVSKWRLKNIWHYILMTFGLLEYILFSAMHQLGLIKSNPEDASILQNIDIRTLGLLIIVILICLPLYYFIVQLLLLSRIILVNVYNKKKKWFEVALVIDDVASVIVFSMLI